MHNHGVSCFAYCVSSEVCVAAASRDMEFEADEIAAHLTRHVTGGNMAVLQLFGPTCFGSAIFPSEKVTEERGNYLERSHPYHVERYNHLIRVIKTRFS